LIYLVGNNIGAEDIKANDKMKEENGYRLRPQVLSL